MSERITSKWRPPLALIICGAMVGIIAVPVVGIAYFRVAGNVLGWAETAWMVVWLAIISAAILGYLLWRLVLRPVNALTAHAQAMKAGRADVTAPSHFGTPEFRALGQSVIDMGETLQNRATGVRAYADHVTHELKSPLTAITGAAELLQGPVDGADRVALARTVSDAAARMEALLSDMRRHAAAGQSNAPGMADLAQVAATLGDLTVVVTSGGMVPMPPDALHAVLAQLVQNAVAHGATRIEISYLSGGLQIADNGAGIAAGNQARIFDPFFTTTRVQGGTGMGLSIVRAMLEAHGGRIKLVQSSKGAQFKISF